ncbi:type II toxin-antitoxin system mRNA interferase toxin, RelE/StbE family [Levilactobacillus lindianensis]|uniref:type II toxin-antitoxin system mRNA interferase toxin, RelE/StbE family n=1 Tax=Levilactobacillus lindianensis TaxID=2486018 RepID=UPI00384B7AEC
MRGYRELHIEPDWLLMYFIYDKGLILSLVRTGKHQDLFLKVESTKIDHNS